MKFSLIPRVTTNSTFMQKKCGPYSIKSGTPYLCEAIKKHLLYLFLQVSCLPAHFTTLCSYMQEIYVNGVSTVKYSFSALLIFFLVRGRERNWKFYQQFEIEILPTLGYLEELKCPLVIVFQSKTYYTYSAYIMEVLNPIRHKFI